MTLCSVSKSTGLTPNSPNGHLYPYKTVPVADLIPYARNARTHSDAHVAQVAASIREFGFLNPVLMDGENGIIAGHARVMAAQKLGLTAVPAIEVANLTKAQKRAYILADNKLALNAGWDIEMLSLELKELQADFKLDVIGFNPDELADLLADRTTGLTDPDAVPEEDTNAVTQAGDVWLLGGHRLVCGDSTDPAAVAACLGQEKPHLMVTDPPYGVEYSAGWRNDAMPQKNDPSRWKDGAGRATGAVMNDDRADWREVWALFPGDVAYVWHAGNKANVVAESLLAVGLDIRAQIVWAKNQFVIGRGHYHPHHEPCWYAVRNGATGHWQGDRKQSTLWQIPKPQKSETGHSTQKPVECMRKPIENNSVAGNAVYEPFSGSGTTIIAAEQTGRRCLAIELNPVYVDVAVHRWQEFTGKTATLQGTGQTWEDVVAARSVLTTSENNSPSPADAVSA